MLGPAVADDTLIHRFGRLDIESLRLKDAEKRLTPPGISVLIGGTAEDAAAAMVHAYPDPRKHSRVHEMVKEVQSTSARKIRDAGFDIVAVPSRKLTTHGQIIHREGVQGFSDENLALLLAAFAGEKK